MVDYLVANSKFLVSIVFNGAIILALIWEQFQPRAALAFSLPIRWSNHIALYLLNMFLLRWLTPLLGVATAVHAQAAGWGLFHQWQAGLAVQLAAGILFLDLCGYGLHRLSHRYRLLWRFHRVHHSDPDVDLTSEFKHHPLEYLLNAAAFSAAVLVFGVHPAAIVLHLMLFQFVSVLSHANVRLPFHSDPLIRRLLVTPDMHRIHHSSYQPETDSNYGMLFSFWDRLFGTYVDQPRDGFERLQLGLEEFRSERDLWLDKMLLQPFVNGASRAPDPAPDAGNR